MTAAWPSTRGTEYESRHCRATRLGTAGHEEGGAVTTPAVAPTLLRSDGATTLSHIFCCDPDLALCGADVSADEIVDDADCAVCLDLEEQPCPTCGE